MFLKLRRLPVLQTGFWGSVYFPQGDKFRPRGQVVGGFHRAWQVHVFAQRDRGLRAILCARNLSGSLERPGRARRLSVYT